MHISQFNDWLVGLFVQSSHRLFNRKWALLSPVFICLILLNPSLSQAQPQVAEYEQKVTDLSAAVHMEKKVLVMGDSLSAAYGIDAEKGWVSLLAQHNPTLKVVNASISGETTSGGKQRLAALLDKHQPDVMILELGANDALRGQNLNVTQANLQYMIEACQSREAGCRVILFGVQLPTNYGPAYDALFQKMYRDLAEKNNLLFDPFFIEPVALDPDLMQEDGLHPNAAAQPMILERILPLIQQATGVEP